MRTTIQVKKIYTKQGTTKSGKPYALLKLLANGKYYTTFKPIPQEIKEGYKVELDAESSSIANTFDIKRIISFEAPAETDPNHLSHPSAGVNANPKRSLKEGSGGNTAVSGVSVVQGKTDEAPSFDPLQNFKDCFEEVGDIGADVVAELMREKFEMWRSDRIERSRTREMEFDRRKTKAYTGKEV